MADILASLGASVKSLTGMKSLPLPSYGGGGFGGSYIQPMSMYGNSFGSTLPGTKYDYQTAAGVLWQNPTVLSCLGAWTRAFSQARPILEERKGEKWNPVQDHPLIHQLSQPNPFYSGADLLSVTLVSIMAYGSGYWHIERNRMDGVGELWFVPPVGHGPMGIAPAWDDTIFIKEYFYFVEGKRKEKPLPREDVVFFRYGLNPANPRESWSPLQFAAREIATLNSASTYTGALLRNSAVPSGMIGKADSGLASSTDLTVQQAQEIEDKVNNKYRGDGIGKVFISNLPLKFTPFNWSPKDLSIDKIQQWPQGMVCAILGIPENVAMLPTGEQPTYENQDASMQWWWKNSVIPMQDAFGDAIETQLFQAFDLDPSKWRVAWDRSNVPAVQDYELAKHENIRKNYELGILDQYDAALKQGYEAKDEMRGKYHPSAVAVDPSTEKEPEQPEAPALPEGRPARDTEVKALGIDDYDDVTVYPNRPDGLCATATDEHGITHYFYAPEGKL